MLMLESSEMKLQIMQIERTNNEGTESEYGMKERTNQITNNDLGITEIDFIESRIDSPSSDNTGRR